MIRVDDSDTKSFSLNTIDNIDQIATIKGSGDVVLKAVLSPDTPEIRNQLTWEGADQQTDRITAKLSRADAAKKEVRVNLGSNLGRKADAWVVWCPIDNLINSDPPGKPQDSDVSPTLFPRGPPNASVCLFGTKSVIRNGILIRATLMPANFCRVHPEILLNFKRTNTKYQNWHFLKF